jgi:hypothetical protein
MEWLQGFESKSFSAQETGARWKHWAGMDASSGQRSVLAQCSDRRIQQLDFFGSESKERTGHPE